MPRKNHNLIGDDAASVRRIVDMFRPADWTDEAARFGCLVARLEAIARYRVTRCPRLDARAYTRSLIRYALLVEDDLDRHAPVAASLHRADVDLESEIPF